MNFVMMFFHRCQANIWLPFTRLIWSRDQVSTPCWCACRSKRTTKFLTFVKLHSKTTGQLIFILKVSLIALQSTEMKYRGFSLMKSWLARQRLGRHSFRLLQVIQLCLPSSMGSVHKPNLRLLVQSVIADSMSILSSFSRSCHWNSCSYGPRGNEIISAAIYSTILGKDHISVSGSLQAALSDLVQDHRDPTITLAGFWDYVDGYLISLTKFIEYVATPHVTNLLIQEDLQATENNANTQRLNSKDIGDAFQYSDGLG